MIFINSRLFIHLFIRILLVCIFAPIQPGYASDAATEETKIETETKSYEDILTRVIAVYPTLQSAIIQVQRSTLELDRIYSTLTWIATADTSFSHDLAGFGTPADTVIARGALTRKLESGDRITLDAVLPKADTQSINKVLGPAIDPDAILCSDANPIYRAFTRQAHIEHRPINLSAGVRVLDNVFHIQNVNAYDSRLKGWMGRFRGVATKYLPNYLGWRRCLERFGSDLSPPVMLTQALGK